MLAQVAEVAFDSAQHLFEIKWDGIQCLALNQGRRARLQSRQLTEITLQFPELACLSQFPSGTVLDGELVVLREGRPSLRCIQQRALLQKRTRIEHLSQSTPVTYMVFDLLYFQGQSLMASPLSTRREALQSLIGEHPLPGVLLPEAVRQHGCRLFAQVVRLGLEGVMAKRLEGPYLPGRRSRYWLKIKPKDFTGHTSEAAHRGYSHHELAVLRKAMLKLPGLTESKSQKTKEEAVTAQPSSPERAKDSGTSWATSRPGGGGSRRQRWQPNGTRL